MKTCNSTTAILCAFLFTLFLSSQIKLSSISRLLAVQFQPQAIEVGQHLASNGNGDSPISCDRSHETYDLCSINGPTVLDSTVSTFYAVGRTTSSIPAVEKIRPYPQKNSSHTMGRINEITLSSGTLNPPCKVQHNAPALAFSVGGYTWNFFHAFIDGFIPLFNTVNFISRDDQDLVLVITNSQDWWVHEYADLFHSFSKYPIIILDNDTSTHCFPSATVGLISHGYMNIDPKQLPNSKSILDFHELLDRTYCHNRPSTISTTVKRPRFVIVSRTGSVGRVILNEEEVKKAAEEEGFDVIVFEPKHGTPLRKACELMSSSHAALGVHGAALTYGLFLRPGSVLMQVVGLGQDNVAEVCFGKFARDMKLEYMEYKIGVDESSLVYRYGREDKIVNDPKALLINDEWSDAIMEPYLREQNVRLDIARLRKYLKRAYEKAKTLMVKEG